MRKTLGDLACHAKSLVLPDTDEAYSVDSDLLGAIGEEDAREGIAAFKGFINRLFDTLNQEGSRYDICRKPVHGYEDRSGTSQHYPFLQNIKDILIRIGIRGTLPDKMPAILFDEHVFNKKIPVSKTMTCLRFLTTCGIIIEGADLEAAKPILSAKTLA